MYAPAKSNGFLSPACKAVFTALRPVAIPTGFKILPATLTTGLTALYKDCNGLDFVWTTTFDSSAISFMFCWAPLEKSLKFDIIFSGFKFLPVFIIGTSILYFFPKALAFLLYLLTSEKSPAKALPKTLLNFENDLLIVVDL